LNDLKRKFTALSIFAILFAGSFTFAIPTPALAQDQLILDPEFVESPPEINSDTFTESEKTPTEVNGSQNLYEKSNLVDSTKLAQVRLPFIENQGQIDEKVKYYVSTFAGTIFVTENGLTYSLTDNSDDDLVKGVAITEEFVDSQKLQPVGIEKSDSVVSYFVGEEENWRSGITTYDSVSLGEVWPSIVAELKAYGNNVEKVFKVLPGGNVDDIRLGFDGINGLATSESGELLLETEFGNISMTEPIAFQNIDGEKRSVEVSYVIDDNAYGFVVGDYDPRFTLIIDPSLISTYLGGTGTEEISAITTDSSGIIYVTGRTRSTDFPTTVGALNATLNGGIDDVFVSKLSSDLSTLLASTYLGGTVSADFNQERGNSIVVDSVGNVYVAGRTETTDFPTTVGALNETFNGGQRDFFISKLSNDLTNLLSSTYLGGNSVDNQILISLDPSGKLFAAGKTRSSDFPITPGAFSQTFSAAFGNVFALEISTDLSTLLASTFLHAANFGDFVIDPSGNIILSGTTTSSSFPTTSGAINETIGAGQEIYISKLSNDLSTLVKSTLINSTPGQIQGVAL